MLPTKFRFIWLSSFKGEAFYKSTNQKQEYDLVVDLPTKILDENINLNRIKKKSRLMDGNV
jgi:hypothetical protein